MLRHCSVRNRSWCRRHRFPGRVPCSAQHLPTTFIFAFDDFLPIMFLEPPRPPNLYMRLHTIDLAILTVYLIAITLFGLRFRNSHRSLRDYFLPDRNIPHWAIPFPILSSQPTILPVIL